jgi:uncharacterized protein YecT (DUF1311 family)
LAPQRFPTGRLVLAGASAIVALSAHAAIPGQPNPADVKAVDSCIVDAAGAKTDPGACIGRVAESCLAGAATNPEREGCNNRELFVWEAALNRDYAQLTSLLTDDGIKQALRDAERAFWIDKLKRCSFDRIAHRDAPDSLLAAARCNLRATGRQDLWVVEQINSLKAH